MSKLRDDWLNTTYNNQGVLTFLIRGYSHICRHKFKYHKQFHIENLRFGDLTVIKQNKKKQQHGLFKQKAPETKGKSFWITQVTNPKLNWYFPKTKVTVENLQFYDLISFWYHVGFIKQMEWLDCFKIYLHVCTLPSSKSSNTLK